MISDYDVFQAVVYAFEGRAVPADLLSHGMVSRALKYRASQDKIVITITEELARTELRALQFEAELMRAKEMLARLYAERGI